MRKRRKVEKEKEKVEEEREIEGRTGKGARRKEVQEQQNPLISKPETPHKNLPFFFLSFFPYYP